MIEITAAVVFGLMAYIAHAVWVDPNLIQPDEEQQ